MFQSNETPESAVIFRAFLAVALLTVFARAAFVTVEPLAWAAVADNDDIMRLLSVRAFLDGQDWFDMRQYRMMPPEGLDMHWSRYIDAAIAGLISLFGVFLPPLNAENAALVIWPTLLLAALVILTGAVARRTFGTSAAILAILSLMLWPVVGLGNFSPYRIDHHNVQILMISVMVFCLILPGRPFPLGIAGGLAGAVSLAVGLEMLLVIGIVGVILALRGVFRMREDGDQLIAFATTLFLASALLFAGQTAPSQWSIARCDQLSPPFLVLTAVAALVSVVLVKVVAPLPSFRSRALLFCAASVAAGAALYPLLAPCLEGPYAALPEDVLSLIHNRIGEAQGLFTALEAGNEGPVRLFVPAFIGTFLAALSFAFRLAQGRTTEEERSSVPVLLVFAVLGLAGSFSQLRMLLLAAPAIPLLTGYGLVALLGSGERSGLIGAARSLSVVGAMAATIFLPLIDITFSEAEAEDSPEAAFIGCRSKEALVTLSALPRGVVLSPIDTGAPVILFTEHDSVSGPYHRSPEAFLNGFVPFEGDEASLKSAMERSRADYLLVCRNLAYGDGRSFAHDLAFGADAPWLMPVEGVHPSLVVLKRISD
jgi:hypothetical protein